MLVARKVALGALLTVGVLVSACGGETEKVKEVSMVPSYESLSGRTLVIGNWGGAQTDAEKKYIADGFAADTGVEVKFVDNASGPEALALLQAQSNNITLDIVIGAGPRLDSKGLLAKFPDDLLDVFEETLRPGSFTDTIVEEGHAASVIACNPEVMAKCPTNPAEFWDVENFPGPRAVMDDPELTLGMALQAAGVAQEEVIPIDLDAAIDSMEKLQPDVRVWTQSGSQQQQVLSDHEVGAAIVWNGRAFVLRRDTFPELEIYWDGCVASGLGGYTVMNGAPNKDVAFAYLQWMAEHPEAQAGWASAMTYTMPGKDVLELMEPEAADALPTAHDCVQMDNEWLSENTEAVQQAWREMVSG